MKEERKVLRRIPSKDASDVTRAVSYFSLQPAPLWEEDAFFWSYQSPAITKRGIRTDSDWSSSFFPESVAWQIVGNYIFQLDTCALQIIKQIVWYCVRIWYWGSLYLARIRLLLDLAHKAIVRFSFRFSVQCVVVRWHYYVCNLQVTWNSSSLLLLLFIPNLGFESFVCTFVVLKTCI